MGVKIKLILFYSARPGALCLLAYNLDPNESSLVPNGPMAWGWLMGIGPSLVGVACILTTPLIFHTILL